MKTSLLYVFVLLELMFCSSLLWAEEPSKIAVLAFRPKVETTAQWKPLADYIHQAIPDHDFLLETYNYHELEQAISNGSVDYVLTQPAHYVLMTHRNGLSSPLATLIKKKGNHQLATFGGVIFTRFDRDDINQLTDIKGKTIAAPALESLGAFQMQAMVLHLAGININDDANLHITGMPHDTVVESILKSEADIGFVRTGVLESLVQEGRLNLEQIKIIHSQKSERYPAFPFISSTQLYPEWAFAAMTHTDSDLSRKLASALFSLPHNGDIAKLIGITGFTIPVDYQPVLDLLMELRLPPFEAVPHFTYTDIWQKYSWHILLTLALLSSLFLALFLWQKLKHQRNKLFHDLFQHHGSVMLLLNKDKSIIDDVNFAACQFYGYNKQDLKGMPISTLFSLDTELDHSNIESTLSDGTMKRVSIQSAPLTSNAKKLELAVIQDITERKALELELKRLATTDPLTGLSNRRLFMDRLKQECARLQRDKSSCHSLVMIDLDFFKKINDNYGHHIGDLILQHFSAAVRSVVREIDTTARIGGEEFAILLPDSSIEETQLVMQRLQLAVNNNHVLFENSAVNYTISMGITLLDVNDETPEQSLSRADQALYLAKDLGRNRMECS